ncbi:MAG: cupin domain-containing protein [Gemmatimonadota bacterium]
MSARHFGLRLTWVAPMMLAIACSQSGAPDLGAQDAPKAAAATSAAGHHHTIMNGDDLNWQPAPPIFPAGAQIAVLQGNPAHAGDFFTIRLRFPNGYILPAHFHPTDENVTVISGTFFVGLGDKFSRDKLLPPLHPGDFITAPANANHFATVQGLTVVQVHAVGPFAMTFVNREDGPTRR